MAFAWEQFFAWVGRFGVDFLDCWWRGTGLLGWRNVGVAKGWGDEMVGKWNGLVCCGVVMFGGG